MHLPETVYLTFKSVELFDRVQVRDDPRFLMPNAGHKLRLEAGVTQ
jgi:hypothetical protein